MLHVASSSHAFVSCGIQSEISVPGVESIFDVPTLLLELKTALI